MTDGQADMQQLLQQAQKMQQDLMSAQEELANAQVKGSAGGGLVTATVTGAGELVGLRIKPEAIDPSDLAESAETVADLVLAAVRDADRGAGDLQARAVGHLTEGLSGHGDPPGISGGV
ncbi:MAG: YbaB/EbfC family nucleoid-associated protein [Streptomycetales bacterium]